MTRVKYSNSFNWTLVFLKDSENLDIWLVYLLLQSTKNTFSASVMFSTLIRVPGIQRKIHNFFPRPELDE